MTFENIIGRKKLGRFLNHLEGLGLAEVRPFSKGTTSLVFLGELNGKKVVVKLQRPDSPRNNFEREARILKTIEPFGITPPLLFTGVFEGLPYLVREFAEGEPVLYADIEKRHLFGIAEKTALLDRLYLDHGQIQGGKHIIVGEDVYIIDFEKAGWRKPNNLTSAFSMLFVGRNAISERLYLKFGLDEGFREEVKEALREYKRTGKLSRLLGLLSGL
ncbi:serine/threonine protein kinase [Thermococcus sp. 21S9]|uniref:serine/threonine protein kinase n=1 Tax=Thermococcus sp. 21S9 TaxID=1638223 RepID=UPI001439657D|nr:serine/threonine protein kinase [Thermococcus sp. 21S9]NJE54279.1 serine/threonine protein kinase [Thermococcus sp. 21S9]